DAPFRPCDCGRADRAQGSRTIPRSRARTMTPETPPGEGDATERRRVLIVDDDPDFLTIAEASLLAHGFVVAEALRADPATAHTAILACTGRRDLEARALFRSSAFDAVLVKPVDWEEVAHYLGGLIGH